MVPYASARSRAQLIDVLLASQLALWVLRAIGGVVQMAAPDSGLAAMCLRGERMSMPFVSGLLVATGVVVLFWVDRCALNLQPLGAPKPLTPEHAVGLFFVPLVNVVAVPYVVRHVWYGSDPTPPRHGRLLLALWWAPLLAALPAAPHPLLLSALMVTAGAAFLAIVRDTQRRQDEHFRDDELRRAVPSPTADALR